MGQEKMKLFYIRRGPAGSDLIRVKCHVIGHHLVYDPNQLAGAMTESCIVVATFRTFFIVKFFEGSVVLATLCAVYTNA